MTVYVPVPVEERLPPILCETHVLKGKNIPHFAYVDEDGRWMTRSGNQLFTVTHWLEKVELPDTWLISDHAANRYQDEPRMLAFQSGVNLIINLLKGIK